MAVKESQQSFLLKADFFPMTVLKMSSADLPAISKQLADTIAKAPNYFTQAPVVIDVDSLKRNKKIDLASICSVLREHNIIPIGVRGLRDNEIDTAKSQGLAILAANKTNETQPIQQAHKDKPAQEQPATTNNKIITKPLRAGTQVYAKDGDLIILAAVNAGAECIADGNIHIYGPLRGRALAGARGNTNARIFCKSLEAELISIAGHYVVNENLHVPKTNAPMLQVFLKNDALHIEGI